MKSDNLFKFIYLLIEHKILSASNIARELEVSTRTVYRYMESLSLAGIPVYAQKGRGGGIRLMDGFKITKSMLSDIEQKEILAGLSLLNALDEKNTNDAFLKLKALFNKSPENWIEVDFSRWGSSEVQQHKFELIKKSIIEHLTIQLSYVNSTGDKSSRSVNPLKIVFKDRAWYLIAHCHSRNSLRIFKIARISNVSLTNKIFNRDNYDLTNYKPFIGPPQASINIVMNIDKKLKHRAYDEFELSSIHEDDSGIKVSFKASEDEWLYGYVASFRGYARIISPAYINNDIKQWMQKTLSNFSI